MPRYRPPAPRSSPYITPDGARALQEELKRLWKVERPEVTRKVAEAAALGDRSENAEYIYGKKQLREIDRRVRFLSKRLDALTVVDRAPPDQDKVFFGAWVTLEDETGMQYTWRIVGPDEFDPKRNWISIDSPVARRLLKKGVDDEIPMQRDGRDETWVVTAIRYTPPEA